MKRKTQRKMKKVFVTGLAMANVLVGSGIANTAFASENTTTPVKATIAATPMNVEVSDAITLTTSQAGQVEADVSDYFITNLSNVGVIEVQGLQVDNQNGYQIVSDTTDFKTMEMNAKKYSLVYNADTDLGKADNDGSAGHDFSQPYLNIDEVKAQQTKTYQLRGQVGPVSEALNEQTAGQMVATIDWKQSGTSATVTHKSASGKVLGTTTVNGKYGQTVQVQPEAYNGYTSTAKDVVLGEAQEVEMVYTPIEYNITYNLDGGSLSGQKTSYNIESAAYTLPTPTKSGFEFAGWYSDSGFANKVSDIALGSTGDKTFYAKWNAIDATITLDAANSKLQGEWSQNFLEGTEYYYPININVKGNNIGTLTYEWRGDLWYTYNEGFNDPEIIESNLFTDVKTNTITKERISQEDFQTRGTFEGTCKITNTYKGVSHSITVEWEIVMI